MGDARLEAQISSLEAVAKRREKDLLSSYVSCPASVILQIQETILMSRVVLSSGNVRAETS